MTAHRTATLPTILVVDDFADGRELLVEYLTYRGFTVHSAADAEQAITAAQTIRPNIVLMDLNMPGLMDGCGAANVLKADSQTRDIVVIAVTARTSQQEVHAARKAGCDAVICKPFDITALGDALPRVLTDGVAALDVPGLSLNAQRWPSGRLGSVES
jgi:CheY-like chemotaxis protein